MDRSKNLGFWVSLLSIASAFGIHIYLTTLHFNLKVGSHAVESICDVSASFNCQTSLASAYSEVLGVPLSIWALGLHLLLLAFLLAYKFPVVGMGGPAVSRRMSRSLALAILLASVVMLAISAFALDHYCPMCVALYGLSLVTFTFVLLATKEEDPSKPAWKEVLRWSIYSALFFIIFGFGIGRAFLQNQAGAGFQSLVRTATAEWQMARPQSSPLPPAASIGPETAPMVVTEFADFLCGYCKNAAQRLDAFVSSRPDVKFEFYSFPLDGDCNPNVARPHGLSCKLAYTAHCGFEQTGDLAVHHWIFRHQEQFRSMDLLPGLIEQMSQDLSLDHENLISCSESDEVKEAITAQAAAGARWGVQGTPSIFVNGKRLPPGPTLPYLEAIYSAIQGQN